MTTMPDIILPPGLMLPPSIQPKDEPDADAAPKEKSRALPEPTGWKVLCMVPELAKKFEGTVIERPDAYVRQEEIATTVLFVLKVGPDAYKDTAKFPAGAWCKPGDFVLVRAYAGTRFKIYGKEFRLLNDDMVEAVVDDPSGFSRA